ncbi:Aste57867_21350 [Aphanomyces stellatus]|uniref:Aste57867_21350 protein n=1 Tax=Aphanomyces stellatus TaxID=120398 RepID=A0A485LHX3_9STRA|nr:hypothetical protein As57867_021281 [Aphanomyces stellatus]VFT98022.1 Aste57867_21350 [Aphanomyces stellatus]
MSDDQGAERGGGRGGRGCPKPNLSQTEREGVLQHLMKQAILPPGTLDDAAKAFGCSSKTVGRIWAQAKASLKEGRGADVASRKKGRCGKKRKYPALETMVKAVPEVERTSWRAVAVAVGVPPSVLHDAVKRGDVAASLLPPPPPPTNASKGKTTTRPPAM